MWTSCLNLQTDISDVKVSICILHMEYIHRVIIPLYFYCAGDINKCHFLETERGCQYEPVFKAIRVQHILNDVVSVKTLEADGIIPESEQNCLRDVIENVKQYNFLLN